LEPVDLDGRGAATLFLLNPTGGVLGGDRLETAVELGAGSQV
jgi:urease accessory protein UreH